MLLIAVIVLIGFAVYLRFVLRSDYKPNPKYLPNPLADQLINEGIAKYYGGDLDGALESFTKAIQLAPHTALAAYLNRAVIYTQRQDFDAAIADCNTLIGIRQTVAPAYVQRGLAYGQKNEWNKALADFDKAIHLDPNLTDSYFAERAKIKYSLGRQDDAFGDVNHALELNPKSFHAYVVRGAIHSAKADFDNAIEDYTRAIELNSPELELTYYNRALAYIAQKKWNEAIRDFDEAIKLKPDFMIGYYRRGTAYLEQKSYTAAQGDFEKVIELNPDNLPARHNRAYICWKQGKLTEAFLECDRILEEDENFSPTYNLRGNIQYHQSHFEAAMADFEKAIAVDAKYAATYQSRGALYYTLNELENALADFTKASEFPDHKDFAAAGLAVTHHAMGDVDEARRLWLGLVEQDARFKDADWVKGELNWAEPLVNEARKLIAGLGDKP